MAVYWRGRQRRWLNWGSRRQRCSMVPECSWRSSAAEDVAHGCVAAWTAAEMLKLGDDDAEGAACRSVWVPRPTRATFCTSLVTAGGRAGRSAPTGVKGPWGGGARSTSAMLP